jgi:hypothetical protein
LNEVFREHRRCHARRFADDCGEIKPGLLQAARNSRKRKSFWQILRTGAGHYSV